MPNKEQELDDQLDAAIADTGVEDPMDTNVDDVDTSFSVIVAGIYDLTLTDISVGPSTKNPNHKVMKLTFSTREDTTDTKGRPVYAGFPVYYYIGLSPTPGGLDEATGKTKRPYTNDDIKKKVALIAQRVGVKGRTIRDVISNKAVHQEMIGQVVRAKVKVGKETEEYDANNVISSFLEVDEAESETV